MAQPKKQIGAWVTLTPAQREALRQLAEHEGRSQSGTLRHLLEIRPRRFERHP